MITTNTFIHTYILTLIATSARYCKPILKLDQIIKVKLNSLHFKNKLVSFRIALEII